MSEILNNFHFIISMTPSASLKLSEEMEIKDE